ncbi:hypothetical protein Ae201684P_020406 [Aphanomyces euteiches]|nr:hypothetical protein Ae201684P_020406 [Aphanomyces euteiches]
MLPTSMNTAPHENMVQVAAASAHCGKFTCRHDIHLLQHVSIVRPWEADHGKLIAAWDDIAIELSRHPDFGMTKKASALKARFKTIIAKFIKGEKLSVCRMTDYDEMAAARRSASQRKTEAIENSGLVIRQLAMDELANDEPAKKKTKRPPPSIAINLLMESIQEAIDEKKRPRGATRKDCARPFGI